MLAAPGAPQPISDETFDGTMTIRYDDPCRGEWPDGSSGRCGPVDFARESP